MQFAFCFVLPSDCHVKMTCYALLYVPISIHSLLFLQYCVCPGTFTRIRCATRRLVRTLCLRDPMRPRVVSVRGFAQEQIHTHVARGDDSIQSSRRTWFPPGFCLFVCFALFSCHHIIVFISGYLHTIEKSESPGCLLGKCYSSR